MARVNTLEVRTTVDRSREDVFAVLADVTRYPAYSSHLRDVAVDGDGGEGTRYRLRFGWWRVTYDAHTAVTAVEEPATIAWEVTRDVDAEGRWIVESTEDGGSRVRFVVSYDPSSASSGIVDLPRLVSLDWVIDRAIDLIEREGRRVVERVVADLEGERRSVDLTVERR